ncbi:MULTISPECIES: energy-coupling factor ABC transporter ATP-binding protein [Loigolactobacillus]|uniref:Energy-coupling factor transporter ATP-binding protein EcfA2 n=1 Tax=Loigolactobacillus backii TaxID=375175 RepID=A0A192H5R2_9LACO|nr:MULTISPECIES: energy-coupling factor ABC transporter ATP-binding protein [Loigolactobacillus]ANK60947.1 energy-coupling factor transporter ATPase [Loigolactobacillus backii]ANK63547.1 energy-coupling factor transporter ATPase [Loigolactobacillus backii]ANK65899.1 energy-coupling factor transporter ATPase [Loigolactobacillus backii]ANK68375.1 energy-coupling factor transporter ATPase [Loigolactobacillus backii]ANK70961.1 energy-coupling factor transporter ATPase [Loigolactobacillus backii]
MDITFKDVGYTYQVGTPFESRALHEINLTLRDHAFTAIIGHTGSGKSTLVQHLNALLKPTSGTVTIGDRVITPETNNKNLKPIRQKVGMVFQFPESQLFEETVAKDIAFGPMNFGVSEEESLKRAKEMVQLVGLKDAVLERSPFDLSGGQMRRVAIAGVLAMKPEVLILDEPTAGLDPEGRRDIMGMVQRLHQENQLTVILITHLMEDVANYADQVVVMENGGVVKVGTPREVFSNVQWLRDKQLGVPETAAFADQLIKKGFQFKQMPLTETELADELLPQLPQAGRNDNVE